METIGKCNGMGEWETTFIMRTSGRYCIFFLNTQWHHSKIIRCRRFYIIPKPCSCSVLRLQFSAVNDYSCGEPCWLCREGPSTGPARGQPFYRYKLPLRRRPWGLDDVLLGVCTTSWKYGFLNWSSPSKVSWSEERLGAWKWMKWWFKCCANVCDTASFTTETLPLFRRLQKYGFPPESHLPQEMLSWSGVLNPPAQLSYLGELWTSYCLLCICRD